MKIAPILSGSSCRFIPVVLLMVSFSAAPLQAQSTTAVESYKTGYQNAISKLDVSWDEASYNMPVYSTTYKKTSASPTSTTYIQTSASPASASSLGIYSFKGNVKDAPSQRVADQRLKTFAALLRKATDEIAAVYEQQTFDGELKQLKPLLDFLDYTVSNKPLSLRTMNLDRKQLMTLKPVDFETSTFRAEALTQMAEKLAATQWMATNKHLTYKFMAANMLMIPTFWAFLEPEFSRLVREAGASSDKLVFMKLHMNRLPFIEQDGRIWNKAPRFQSNQLNVVAADAGNQSRSVKKVELSDTETKVTVRYNVGGREIWYRFDNSLVLVDNETKELYPIQRIENQIPLGKTFIVVGCEGKAVEFTFVFPPLKKTLEQFVIDDNLSIPSSDKAKKRFLKKHGIMSDGGGRSPIIIYNLSDFVPANTLYSGMKAGDPRQESSNLAALIDPFVDERKVTEPKSNGGKTEWTYRSDRLVGRKIYFPSGKLEYAYTYDNGILEGDSYQYYESGKLRKKFTYQLGRMVSSEAYYETGELQFQYGYKNGIQDGPTLEYDKMGKVIKEWNYVNGKRNGTSKEYHENGGTADRIYVSDELVSGVTYYPSGKKQELINYKKGVRDGESFQYYETGELQSKSVFLNGKKTEQTLFYETGEIKTTYSVKNGELDGPTVSYYKSGKIKQETMMKEGLVNGTNKLYYENGNLRLIQNLVNGKQNGELIEYDINGKIIRKEMYQDNKLVN